MNTVPFKFPSKSKKLFILTMWYSKYLKIHPKKNNTVLELSGKVQKYDWGKKGHQSMVAELYKNVHKDFEIENGTPYAELWFGANVKAPSDIKNEGKNLLELLKEKPEYLGEKIKSVFGKEKLPFLFKILSIEKALSIQVHPDKEMAKQLHSKFPDVYKDNNHKPEIAVALTPFEALCGFRPYNEIKKFFEVIPELGDLIGADLCEIFINSSEDVSKTALKNCFCSMMTKPQEVISRLLNNFLSRSKDLDVRERELQLCGLVERLNSQFPEDVGCFAVFFLNYLSLNPMQAVFLAANIPHAYLSGDCVECMACSDNVVRAGLTPKFKDVETLCAILNYDGESAHSKLFLPQIENEYIHIFKPPVEDFAIVKIDIKQKMSEFELIPRETASIFLVISGSAKLNKMHLISGSSLFIPAAECVKLKDLSNDFLAFQAVANV
ncbi:mannose-6-phosphate isomerase isoform X1 [Onthophagus taurus]|uniref:mannose-6-phosphate isomerase isoform X1 n=1 Tax=Onthophagus taurus TaxID=166361 RepID=UPI0039BDF8E4